MNSLTLYRRMNTRARRTRATAIEHSGGSQTIYGCICGARHTCATSYRQARHVSEWRKEHDRCLDVWAVTNLGVTIPLNWLID